MSGPISLANGLALWQQALANMQAEPDYRYLHSFVGNDSQRLDFLGKISQRELLNLLDKKSYPWLKDLSKTVYVLPVYQAPGQLSCLLILDREQIYQLPCQEQLSGLILLDNLLNVHTPACYVVSDLVYALRWHYLARQAGGAVAVASYRKEIALPPLLTSYMAKFSRRVIVTNKTITLAELRLAYLLQAEIVRVEPQRDLFLTLKEITNQVSWCKPLLTIIKQLLGGSTITLTRQLATLYQQHGELTTLLSQLTLPLQAKVQQALTGWAQVTINNTLVQLYQSSWYIVASQERLSNLHFIITDINYYPRKTYYRGVAYYKDASYIFQTAKKDFTKKPWWYLSRYLAKKQHGYVYYQPCWQRHAWSLSLALYEPSVTYASYPLLGWHKQQQRYYFANYYLDNSGRTYPKLLSYRRLRELPTPRALTLAEQERLGNLPVVGWVVLTAITYNICSKLYDWPSLTILSHEHNKDWLATLGQQLGCLVSHHLRNRVSQLQRSLTKYNKLSQQPCIFINKVLPRLIAAGNYQHIFSVSYLASRSLLLREHTVYIPYNSVVTSDLMHNCLAPVLLPSLVQFILQNRLQPKHTQPWAMVKKLLNEWLAGQHNQRRHAALSCLVRQSQRQAHYFVQLLRLLRHGLSIKQQDNKVIISSSQVNKLLHKQQLPFLQYKHYLVADNYVLPQEVWR